MKSVLSLIIILFLISSNIPFGFTEVPVIDVTSSEISPIVFSTPKESRNISVSLQESVGISTNSPLEKDPTSQPIVMSTSSSLGKMVYLSESLHITSSIFEQTIALNSYIMQPQATLDRVSQIDKVKDRKKNSKADLLLADESVDNLKIDITSNLLLSNNLPILTDPLLILENNVQHNFYDEFLLFSENSIIDPTSKFIFSFDNLLNTLFSETDQQYVLIIFAPLVFFLLLRSEGFEFNISKLHTPLAFIFVVILLSTTVITPYSISSSYWPMAYADTSAFDDNLTASADNTSSSSTPAEDTETAEVSTSTNSTASADNTSSSSTPAEDTEIAEATTSNQTSINDSVTNSTSIPVTNSTSIPVNGTIPVTNSTSVTRVDVTDDPRFAVEFVDTDGNGIVDRMQWIVPQLSEQEFDIEADLEIINVQSYPAVGGNWKVIFTTNGTADLIITAVNGTTFGTESPDDLTFLELNNGTHTLNPIFDGNTITYYNYSSTEYGFEESKVLTPFAHHLMFQFGNKTAFAHNSAFVPNGPKMILLEGTPIPFGSPDIEDDLALTDPVIPNWGEPATRQDSIFIHSTEEADCDALGDLCAEIQVTKEGTYRVNYGLSIPEGAISATRYQGISYVQNDTDGTGNWNANEGVSCFDSAYSRTSNAINSVVFSGECLVELEANGKVRVGISKISNIAGSAYSNFATDENWFQMQKIENPTISLRKTTASVTIDNTANDMQFLDADIVTYDTSLFTFDGSSANAEILVDVDGLYKVTYSAVVENVDDRSAVIGKIQTNSTGSFVDDIYGGSVLYHRDSSGIEQAALSSSTILDLNAGDAIKLVLVDDSIRTSTSTNYHLDMEYIGTTSGANVLRLHDSTGGQDLDVTSDVVITWDVADLEGSHFNSTLQVTTPITPLIATSNTQESTTSTSMVDTDVLIDGASLQNGVDYLVMYNMGYGVSSTSVVTSVQVVHGSSIIAESSDDGSSSGTPESMRAASLSGYHIITGTGNGADDLKIQFLASTATAYIGGKTIIAIPLDDLTENTDYWKSISNSEDVVTDAAVGSSTELAGITIDLPQTGDYIVLMSAEGGADTSGVNDGEQFRAFIDGAQVKNVY